MDPPGSGVEQTEAGDRDGHLETLSEARIATRSGVTMAQGKAKPAGEQAHQTSTEDDHIPAPHTHLFGAEAWVSVVFKDQPRDDQERPKRSFKYGHVTTGSENAS